MSEQHYLLAIAIGPVQPFIAASRKARDLRAGSMLLSDLCATAARALDVDVDLAAGEQKTRLIFPPRKSLEAEHSVANKLLVTTTRDPARLAGAARSAVQKQLRDLWRDVEPRVRLLPPGSVDSLLPLRQVGDFVEWYATWVPYDPDGPDVENKTAYEAARDRVERLLAGRKDLREFWPAHGVDGRPKSSLDPSLESILTREGQENEDVRKALHLGKAEQLDAISLIKRLRGLRDSDTQSRFVSTSRVAIDPFIRAASANIATPGVSEALDELNRLAGTLAETDVAERLDVNPVRQRDGTTRPNPLAHYAAFPYDSQLFYELSETGAHKHLEAWRDDPEASDASLKTAATDFFNQVKTLKDLLKDQLGELPAYYAVLHADGDRMGKAIGGLKKADHHVEFSEQLGAFAANVEGIVSDHFGAMIYSGGDDVLAFLPLDTAIPCANALRIEFAEIMEKALEAHDIKPLPTLSVGLAIGHYAEHLQAILNRARNAEKAAKGPRDALAVVFSSHSGGGDERRVVHSWDDDPMASRWAKAIEFHRHDTLSDGAAYQLDTLRREFRNALKPGAGVFGAGYPLTIEDAAFAKATLIAETLRILKRKKPRQGSDDTKTALLADVKERLKVTQKPEETLEELGRFVDELIIARRMYRLVLDHQSDGARLWKVEDDTPLLAPLKRPAMAIGEDES